jgi:DNA polymerase III delta prime subunit
MSAHHARLIITNQPDTTMADIIALEKDVAEIITFIDTTLSIKTVRQIIEMAYQTPSDREYRLFVIKANSLAVEAENALLKILEEPPKTSRFLLILPSVSGILDTVLSRLEVTDSREEQKGEVVFQDFLSWPIKKRLEHITLIAKNKDDGAFIKLQNGLLHYLTVNNLSVEVNKVAKESLLYLRQRGTSKKMVWEEIALTLPVVAI